MPDRSRAAYERTPRKAFKTVKQFDRLLGRSNLRDDHYESCKTIAERTIDAEDSEGDVSESEKDEQEGDEHEDEQEEDEQEDSDDVLCDVIATEGDALADGDETDASDS